MYRAIVKEIKRQSVLQCIAVCCSVMLFVAVKSRDRVIFGLGSYLSLVRVRNTYIYMYI